MKIININKCKIAIYHQIPRGKESFPPLLFIHGFTGTAQFHYGYELTHYSNLFQCQTVGYDLRGHGNSSVGLNSINKSTFTGILQDLIELVNYFQWDKVILVGSSFGGFLANAFIHRYPDLVHRLILISSAASSSLGLSTTLKGISALFENFLSNSKLSIKDQQKMLFLLKLHHEDLLPYEKIKFQKNMINQLLNDSIRGWSKITELANFTLPTLIIHGEKDYIELSKALEMKAAIKNSKTHVLPNLGHLPQRKNPKLVEKLVKDFLAYQ